MIKSKKYILLLCICAFLIPAAVQAESQKWRVYNYLTKMHVMPIGFVKTPAHVIFERRGVAAFANGELATYLTRGSARVTPNGGTSDGYAEYTFDDGSTQIIQWQATSRRPEDKPLNNISGTGDYIGGTGRFAGIQGKLKFEGGYITPYSKEKGLMGDMVVEATADYTVPAK